MKKYSLSALAAVLMLSGCGQADLTPSGEPLERVGDVVTETVQEKPAEVMEKVGDVMEEAGDKMMEEDGDVMMEEGAHEAPEKITLAVQAGYTGAAEAVRFYPGDQLEHSVTVTGAAPAEGKFFEGWLVKKGSVPVQFYSTGAMELQADGSYVLSYSRFNDEEAQYSEVVITEETSANGLDNVPEAHVFEGGFIN